ncbi:MAG TPA: flagellar motor protein MotB [Stellaceae bacterium]|jgi:chemotaxis protein MotB|nr:flagellar motor protein MotB [Stellaceae bacterium]
MAKGSNAPLIIKKIKRSKGEAHHGGAWKVAYADFVTAMMSFFLLLWLLNVTTDIQKRGIADYFEPTIASKSQSGAGGVLGGLTIGAPGAQDATTSPPNFQLAVAALRQPNEGDEGDLAGSSGQGDTGDKVGGATTSNQTGGATANAKKPIEQMTEMELQKRVEEREEKQFAGAEFALRQAIQDVPDLKNLADNLIIDRTPEGLRIQIVDQEKRSMFPLGSAQMADSAQKLLGLVALVVQKLPNKVSITGHTDAAPYAFGRYYTNWELSADRANASRRELISDGVSADRIEKVVGLADRDPLVPDDPRSPHNRRISIVLLREAKLTTAAVSEPHTP